MSWDETVPLAGSFPVYWSVTRNADQEVDVYLSPYQQLPETEDQEERQGLTAALREALSTYTDRELAHAATVMANLAWEDWLLAMITNRVFLALREQREREGGYVKTEAEEA